MKIAQVTKYFYPHRGGIESHVLGISEEFIKKSHSITVYSSNKPKTTPEENYNGIKIIRSNTWFTLFNGPFAPGIFLKMLKGDYDVLHVHLPDPANSVFALMAAKLKNKPLYVTYHADIIKTKWYHKPFTFTYKFFLNLVLGGAEKIIATTPNYVAGSQIPDKYKNKIVIAPNFVDAKRFNPSLDGSEIRKEYNLGDKKIVFFLGRLVPYKGVEYIISAFGKAKHEVSDVVLIIAGKGPLEDYLKEQVQHEKIEDVLFVHVEDDAIPKYFAACDLFVLPSVTRQEAFGIALLEAMACGKPTITTNISGMPYVVGDSGLTVTPEDVDELTHALLLLLSDENLRKELGSKGRKRVEELFQKEVVAQRILEIYEKKNG